MQDIETEFQYLPIADQATPSENPWEAEQDEMDEDLPPLEPITEEDHPELHPDDEPKHQEQFELVDDESDDDDQPRPSLQRMRQVNESPLSFVLFPFHYYLDQ